MCIFSLGGSTWYTVPSSWGARECYSFGFRETVPIARYQKSIPKTNLAHRTHISRFFFTPGPSYHLVSPHVRARPSPASGRQSSMGQPVAVAPILALELAQLSMHNSNSKRSFVWFSIGKKIKNHAQTGVQQPRKKETRNPARQSPPSARNEWRDGLPRENAKIYGLDSSPLSLMPNPPLLKVLEQLPSLSSRRPGHG